MTAEEVAAAIRSGEMVKVVSLPVLVVWKYIEPIYLTIFSH